MLIDEWNKEKISKHEVVKEIFQENFLELKNLNLQIDTWYLVDKQNKTQTRTQHFEMQNVRYLEKDIKALCEKIAVPMLWRFIWQLFDFTMVQKQYTQYKSYFLNFDLFLG